VVKVEGIIFGNNLRASGSNNSMNGTMIKIENGINRIISEVVVTRRRRSRRVRVLPRRGEGERGRGKIKEGAAMKEDKGGRRERKGRRKTEEGRERGRESE
jgi:hypothetical protein